MVDDDESTTKLISAALYDLKASTKAAKVLTARVEGVLRSLPVPSEKEPLIESTARIITDTFIGVQRAIVTGVQKQLGDKAARRYLTRLTKRAEKLAVDLKSVPINFHEAISASIQKKGLASPKNLAEFLSPSIELNRDIKRLIDVLHDADKRLAETKGRAKKGAPISRPAAEVAYIAARVFTLLTGKPATPGFNPYTEERSSFEQFLGDINAVFGIEASAEHRARSLARDIKRKK